MDRALHVLDARGLLFARIEFSYPGPEGAGADVTRYEGELLPDGMPVIRPLYTRTWDLPRPALTSSEALQQADRALVSEKLGPEMTGDGYTYFYEPAHLRFSAPNGAGVVDIQSWFAENRKEAQLFSAVHPSRDCALSSHSLETHAELVARISGAALAPGQAGGTR